MSYADEVNKKFLRNSDNYLYPTNMDNIVLRLETTNICNHMCYFCPNSKLRGKRRFIEPELAIRIIEEAYDMGIKKAGLFIMGEPLLDKHILNYYKHASQMGYTSLFLTTNGSLATEDMIKGIFDSGVTSLKFSINGGTPKTYKKVHGQDDYNKAMAALKFAKLYRDNHNINCRILSSYIVTKDNVCDIKIHYNHIIDYVDDFAFFGMATFASSVLEETQSIKTEFEIDNIEHIEFANNCPCALLENSINVTCEGYLRLCVTDPYNFTAIEDLHCTSLKDAWYSKKMTKIRQMHLEGKINGTICDNCINLKNDKVEPFNKDLYEANLYN